MRAFAILVPAVIAACGGGDGSSDVPETPVEPEPPPQAPVAFRGLSQYEVQYWGAADAVAQLNFESGLRLRIDGVKDADGVPHSITQLHYSLPSSADASTFDEGTLEIANDGTPSLLIAPDGARLSMAWGSDGMLSFVFLNADGSRQAVSSVDLGALRTGPAERVSPSASSGSRAWRPLQRVSAVEHVSKQALATPLASKTKTVSIDVKRCGQPVEDAKVALSFRPDNINQWLPSVVNAKHTGQGTYTVDFTVSDALQGLAGKSCKAVAGLLGNGCEITKTIKGQELEMCAKVAATIDVALGGPTGEGLPIAAVCTTALKSYNAYCAVHDGPVEGSTDLSAADFVCNAVASLEDALPAPGETRYMWSASAAVEGAVAKAGPVYAAYKDNVSMSIDFGGTPSISSLATRPFDPPPLADYIVSAASTCTRYWTSTLEVFGTDGYTDVLSLTNSSGAQTMDLSVPGAEAGVSDRLVFKVTPPAGTSAPPLQRQIGITF